MCSDFFADLLGVSTPHLRLQLGCTSGFQDRLTSYIWFVSLMLPSKCCLMSLPNLHSSAASTIQAFSSSQNLPRINGSSPLHTRTWITITDNSLQHWKLIVLVHVLPTKDAFSVVRLVELFPCNVPSGAPIPQVLLLCSSPVRSGRHPPRLQAIPFKQ